MQNETKTVSLLLSTSRYLVGKHVDCFRKKSYLYSASLIHVKLTVSGRISFNNNNNKNIEKASTISIFLRLPTIKKGEHKKNNK